MADEVAKQARSLILTYWPVAVTIAVVIANSAVSDAKVIEHESKLTVLEAALPALQTDSALLKQQGADETRRLERIEEKIDRLAANHPGDGGR